MFWKKKESKKPEPIMEKTADAKIASYFLKIALLGDGAVGKTNLRRRYLGQGFTSDHLMTIGADFAAAEKVFHFGETQFNVTFQIWDLAGQETFSNVRSMYYKGCFGALMVFDRTRPSSFDNIHHWIKELKKNSGKGFIPIVLLGNKYDLVDTAEEVVPIEDINKLVLELNEEASKKNFQVKYLDTSALTGQNIDDAFLNLGETILTWLGKVN